MTQLAVIAPTSQAQVSASRKSHRARLRTIRLASLWLTVALIFLSLSPIPTDVLVPVMWLVVAAAGTGTVATFLSFAS